MDRTRIAALAIALIFAFLVAFGLVLGSGNHAAEARAEVGLRELLAVTDVEPDIVPNDLDTAIVISGTGFAVITGTYVITPPAVFLGEIRLPDITWVSSTQLLSVVPWGLDPGVYALTVANPDGVTATLTGALTVTQAIGVWTTDGPYGGSVLDVAVRPGSPGTVFAIASLAGLFGSHDAGDLWERTGLASGRDASHISYGSASPSTLFACGGSGLWQSTDDGQTWLPVIDDVGCKAFAQHPSIAGILYASVWDAGIYRSEDGGQTWESRSSGIDQLRVRTITVDPSTPTTLYATTDQYGVYKSTDEGLSWSPADGGLADDPDDNFYELAVDPYDSDNVWAVGVYAGHFFQSVDGAASWVTVPITYPVQRALAYSPVVSGTLYAGATHDLIASSDGGDTWSRLNGAPLQMIEEIEVDRFSGSPLYLGTNGGGVSRSLDGGIHWEQVVQGMTGIEPRAVVPAPAEPERVYFAAVDGAFRSNNGGGSWVRDWQEETWTAAVDPADSLVAYVSPTPGWGACTVAKTTDGGQTWSPQTVCSQPERYVTGITFYPDDSQALLAGGGDNWGHFAGSHGWVARSGDGGSTWQELSVVHVISDVTSILVDPVVTQTLFLGSCTIHPYWNLGSQSGIYKSTDGGGTWGPANTGLTHRCVRDLVMHPVDHELLLAAVNDPAPGAVGVFRSTDGGESWSPSNDGLDTSRVLELAFDPLTPSTVYAATWHGLYQSRDDGQSWSRAAGPLGHVPVFSVAAVGGDGRTLVYIGTVGGSIEGLAAGPQAEGFVEAGVYRQAVLPDAGGRLYLPLVLRAQ